VFAYVCLCKGTTSPFLCFQENLLFLIYLYVCVLLVCNHLFFESLWVCSNKSSPKPNSLAFTQVIITLLQWNHKFHKFIPSHFIPNTFSNDNIYKENRFCVISKFRVALNIAHISYLILISINSHYYFLSTITIVVTPLIISFCICSFIKMAASHNNHFPNSVFLSSKPFDSFPSLLPFSCIFLNFYSTNCQLQTLIIYHTIRQI